MIPVWERQNLHSDERSDKKCFPWYIIDKGICLWYKTSRDNIHENVKYMCVPERCIPVDLGVSLFPLRRLYNRTDTPEGGEGLPRSYYFTTHFVHGNITGIFGGWFWSARIIQEEKYEGKGPQIVGVLEAVIAMEQEVIAQGWPVKSSPSTISPF